MFLSFWKLLDKKKKKKEVSPNRNKNYKRKSSKGNMKQECHWAINGNVTNSIYIFNSPQKPDFNLNFISLPQHISNICIFIVHIFWSCCFRFWKEKETFITTPVHMKAGPKWNMRSNPSSITTNGFGLLLPNHKSIFNIKYPKLLRCSSYTIGVDFTVIPRQFKNFHIWKQARA